MSMSIGYSSAASFGQNRANQARNKQNGGRPVYAGHGNCGNSGGGSGGGLPGLPGNQ